MSGAARPGSPLLVLVGPTGTGKSEIAVEVARAIGGEIVGCDALQVYCGFDAATAKPDAVARRSVPHHLVDYLDPRTDFTLMNYVRAAETVVDAVAARGRVPMIVGGTGLYLRGLLRGVLRAPGRNPELRERLRRIVRRGGRRRLRTLLSRHDAAAERRIAPGDTQRLLRAFELARSAGGSWSERLRRQGSWSERDDRYPALKIGLDIEREQLRRRLDARVDRFFDGGLVDEVRRLLDSGVPPEANAFKAIGYREVLAAMLAGADPQRTRLEVQRRTHGYSKRQRTWFRKEPDLIWLDASAGTEPVVRRIVELWRRWPSSPPA